MNIFILDLDHDACAAAHADQHVGKMLLEACQLLCNAHPEPTTASRWLTPSAWRKATPDERLRAGMLPYKHTHRNHPCAIWTRLCPGNYVWLLGLAYALADEWEYRFKTPHASRAVVDWCAEHAALANFTQSCTVHTPFALAMPEQYRCDDAVTSYRRYYAAEKRILRGKPAQWTRRPRPEWFDKEMI